MKFVLVPHHLILPMIVGGVSGCSVTPPIGFSMGTGNTHGVWVMGCAGMGMVFEIPTCGYTIICTCSTMGIHGYNKYGKSPPCIAKLNCIITHPMHSESAIKLTNMFF